MIRPRTVGTAGLCFALGLVAGCGAPAAAPPRPDLALREAALVEVIQLRTRAVEANPSSSDAWGGLGITFDVHDLVDPAIECYREAQRLDARDFRWSYFRGVLASVGDQRGALPHLERASELRPDYAPAHVYRGRAHLFLDDLDSATAAFQRATDLDSSLTRAHIGLAKIALARGQVDDADHALETAASHGADSAEYHRLRGEVARRRGHLDESRDWNRRATGKPALEPLSDPIRRRMQLDQGVTLRWRRERCQAHLAAGRPDDAKAEWEGWLAREPDSAVAHLELAELLARTGNFADAIPHYESARSDPEVGPRALLGLGVAFSRVARSSEAIPVFREAIARDPELHEARTNLGVFLMTNGQKEEGLSQMRTAATARPNNIEVQLNFVRALEQCGKPEEALRVLEATSLRSPHLLRIQFELGRRLAARGRYVAAAEAFRQVLDGEPDRANAHINLVRALDNADRGAEAIEAAREGLRRIPENIELSCRLAWLLVAVSDEDLRSPAEAKRIMGAVLGRTGKPSRDILSVLAATQAATGDFEGAVETIRDAQSLEGDALMTRLATQLSHYEQREPWP